ncbi:SDR family NAD(P)-dependent oxidoreductase [Streptomyces sp. FR-108]|uniref:SDR family NAD(P)-dependent oxidoreductase n=1 Tax=Streptomyces sp. FR-108 TaxID=3416665 RepID=UPI003CE86E0C
MNAQTEADRPVTRDSWAMVTGSTSGIGRETALLLAEDGYRILVCGRDRDRAAETRKTIVSAGGQAVDLVADLTDIAAVRRLIDETRQVLDGEPLDVLINNAGGGVFAPTEATTETMFDDAFNLNVKAPYMLVGEFAPLMAERGRGAIVNVGSLSTRMAASGTSAFQAAKAALSMLTKSWTAEYGPRGVRVNSVDPGYILTRVNEDIRDMFGNYLASLPAGRGGTPQEVAEVIRFLVSPQASYVQGAVLAVDGGKNAVVVM